MENCVGGKGGGDRARDRWGRAGNDQKHIRLEESADVIEETLLLYISSISI